MQPRSRVEIPEQTVLVARAAFPQGSVAVSVRDELGGAFHDERFVRGRVARARRPSAVAGSVGAGDRFAVRGEPDRRQAAQMVARAIDWKYALGLELTDPGFDPSVLSKFRTRLVEHGLAEQVFAAMLTVLGDKGLVRAGGKQRTDSTHVIGAVRDLNRLELAGESVRACLEALTVLAPQWLATVIDVAEWAWPARADNRSAGPRRPVNMIGVRSAQSQSAAAVLAAILTMGLIGSPAAAQPSLGLTALEPGSEVVHSKEIPVNVVFLGGEPVDHAEVAAQLPATYEPVNRIARALGLEARPLGLHYQLDYRFIDAPDRLVDRFFRFLSRTGELAGRTEAQEAYTDQELNRLDVPEQVLHIDAQRVERWLNTGARAALGLARDSYTVYVLDWFGQADFQFHVYNFNGLDPDSGQPLAARDVSGWGGTGRSWFYDLSAGPVFLGGGWNVDDGDVTGDGLLDYRIPPSWEYHPDGFRDPRERDRDLGKLVRYGAVNPLFTPSPIYDPMVTAPGPGGAKVLSIHVFQALPGGDAIKRIDPDAIREAFAGLQPYHTWRVELADSDPVDADVRRTLDIFLEFMHTQLPPADPGCWEPFGQPNLQLFCFFEEHRDRYFAPAASGDYQAPAAVIELSHAEMLFPGSRGIGGTADLDWRDPSRGQLFTYLLSSPEGMGNVGVSGHSGFTAHEYAHHFGLSHPYDGWDSETEEHYVAAGDLMFAAAAAQVQSAVASLGLVDLRAPLAFSQFERDNLARWDTVGHLNRANLLLEQVLAHPRAHQVRHLVTAADQRAAQALRQFADWRYDQAAAAAIRAYGRLVTAAQQLGIDQAAGLLV
jgi:hypothetical protein